MHGWRRDLRRPSPLRCPRHPLSLTFEAEGVEVFDLTESGTRVLSAAHATARPILFSWLRGRHDLSALALEQAEIDITKDLHGVFNWERLVRLKPSSEGQVAETKPLFGWKYQDWVFNVYERLRRTVDQSDQRRTPRNATRFRIAKFRLQGRGVLTDRSMTPLVVEKMDIRLDGLKWLKNGDMEWETVSAKGRSRSKRPGQFNLRLQRRGAQIRGSARLDRVNLEPLLPLYASSSPVLFEKGFLTLQSELRLTADSIDSHVLQALNRHPVLDLHFNIRGDPNHPVFDGAVESFTKILEKDFDPYTLSLIRLRIQEETEKVSRHFGSAPLEPVVPLEPVGSTP